MMLFLEHVHIAATDEIITRPFLKWNNVLFRGSLMGLLEEKLNDLLKRPS